MLLLAATYAVFLTGRYYPTFSILTLKKHEPSPYDAGNPTKLTLICQEFSFSQLLVVYENYSPQISRQFPELSANRHFWAKSQGCLMQAAVIIPNNLRH